MGMESRLHFACPRMRLSVGDGPNMRKKRDRNRTYGVSIVMVVPQ